MPVNQSDTMFFEQAKKIMDSAFSQSERAPSIEDIRNSTQYFKDFLPGEATLPYEKLSIPAPSGHRIIARYIAKDNKMRPLLIFFPGTAFIHPIFDENYTVLSRIIKQTNCHGLMIEYRLSPEFPFPCPHEDAKAALLYVLDNADKLGLDKEKVILSGYSSGANMAAVLSNSLQHSKDFKPFHQYLFSGGYDYTDSLHDFDEYVNQDKMLDKDSQKLSFDMYCQDTDRTDPYCSPYFQEDFSGLCPTTIQCGEYDGGRSQSEAYAKKLLENHVDVEKIIVPGQTHFTLLYRGACSDGEDPASLAANRINRLLNYEN